MKCLLVLSPKGGSGKSTLTANLAVAAVLDGLRVATLDTDRQQSLTWWHDQRPEERRPIAHMALSIEEAAKAEIAGEIDLVIIDTPTAVEEHPVAVRTLIDRASLVITPTQPSVVDVISVVGAMRLVQSLRRPAVFALNRVRPRVRESAEARRELARYGDVCAADIPEAIEVQRAYSRGLGIMEAGGSAANDMAAVWQEVRRKLATIDG
jgi:chromosome partitioning protein